MKNKKIRAAIYAAGMKYWELADLMGIHPSTLSTKLRHELPEKEQEDIIEKIHSADRDQLQA